MRNGTRFPQDADGSGRPPPPKLRGRATPEVLGCRTATRMGGRARPIPASLGTKLGKKIGEVLEMDAADGNDFVPATLKKHAGCDPRITWEGCCDQSGHLHLRQSIWLIFRHLPNADRK